MYRIIGGDGREYGPVSGDQVREWIAQGRANAETRAAGPDGEWKALVAFPEFADAFGAPASGSGAWVEPGPAASTAHPSPSPSEPSAEEFKRAPNLLAPAILCTVCCCMPAGVVAIVKASQANARQAAGDRIGARRLADQAQFWCWVSVALGVVLTMIYIIILIRTEGWKNQ